MNKEIFVISITNDVTLKKFSLKIPFKTFHASADVAASPAPSARISEKILRKGFQRNHVHKRFYIGRRQRSASAILCRRPLKRFEEIPKRNFFKSFSLVFGFYLLAFTLWPPEASH